jgi:hypothetical protein
MDFSSDNLALEILKWVGIVFAAGFVGYFGRYLSMILIERVRRKRAQSTPPTEAAKEVGEITATQAPSPETVELEIEKQKAKLEKKKAKAEAKKVKKKQKK